MTKVSLKQFVTHSVKNASNLFERQDYKLLPMYHAVADDGEEYIFAAPEGDKDYSVSMARIILADMNAVRVVFIDEGWMVEASASDDIDMAAVARDGVAKQPGRKEVIMWMAEDMREGVLMATREIIRHGDRVVLGALKFAPAGTTEGRLIGLLPARGTRQ